MAHPLPSDFELHTNAGFEALMWALSRPALPQRLPTPGFGAIIDALIDRECRVFADDPDLASHAGRAGAELVPVLRADHVFFSDFASLAPLHELPVGSDLYPDDGATLVISARFGEGEDLRFTGPGIDGSLTERIGGLPEGFWNLRRDLIRYPMGFDIFLIDGDNVIGVPRSTIVEVH